MDDGGALPSGMNGRVTRLEEWAKQSDLRMGRMEGKLDQLIASFAELRGDMVTKTQLADERRHAQNVTWAAAGAVIAALSLLAALFQVFQPAARAGATPAPIIIQVPAPPR